jgi:DNA repair protein RadC
MMKANDSQPYAVDAPLRDALWKVVRGCGGCAAAVDGGAEPALPEEADRSGLDSALHDHGLGVLARLRWDVLGEVCGLNQDQAERLAASFQLGRAAERARMGEHPVLKRPGDVARFLAPELRGLEVETFQALVLDARHRLKARVEVSRGTLTMAPVHPREVFAPALRLAGAAVLVAHNHPSGDPKPSPEDIEVTARLVEAGRIVGVPLLDHLVCAGEHWVSLRESKHWPAA